MDLDGLNQMKLNKSKALKCTNEVPWDISRGWKFIGPKTWVGPMALSTDGQNQTKINMNDPNTKGYEGK